MKLLLAVIMLASFAAFAQPKYSMPIRDAQVSTVEQKAGKEPVLKLCSGPIPPTIESPGGSKALATFSLPADWVTTARNAIVLKLGEWKAIATSTGRPTYYRLYSRDGAKHLQGPVSTNSGNGVITIQSLDLVAGKPVVIKSFGIAE